MNTSKPGFFSRLGIALRVLGSAELAARITAAPAEPRPAAPAAAPAPKPAPEAPPEQVHASGLAVLALLQNEGRLVDFLKEDIAAYADADIGAAVRVVHAGCRKVLDQYLTLEHALPGAEGDTVSVQAGADQRVRLTGNVTGQPPFRGTLKHHGWYASSVRLPALSAALDTRVIAPAEVEL